MNRPASTISLRGAPVRRSRGAAGKCTPSFPTTARAKASGASTRLARIIAWPGTSWSPFDPRDPFTPGQLLAA